MSTLSPDTPLSEVQDHFLDGVEDGTTCPVCLQHAQIYDWTLYSTAGRALIYFYRLGAEHEFVHSRRLKEEFNHTGQGDASRLKNWGLMVEEKTRRPDGGRSGHWMLTPLGLDFVLGRATIPRKVRVYNNIVLATEGPQVTIRDVLGNRFDYNELMGRPQ